MTLVAACCLSLTDVRKPGNEGNKWLLQSGWSDACRFDVRYRSLETWRSVKTNMLSDFMGGIGSWGPSWKRWKGKQNWSDINVCKQLQGHIECCSFLLS